MDELETYRKTIDELDTHILELLKKRFDTVKKIGIYKKEKGLGIVDKNREKQVIQRLIQKGKEYRLSKTCIENVWKAIFSESYTKEI